MEDVSLSFYQYLCKHVVGTENHVNTIRLMNTVCDNLCSDDYRAFITSGSFGEGLEMRGSDIDYMYVAQYIEVHDNITSIIYNNRKTHFSLMTENIKPGYVMLRLLSISQPLVLEFCKQFRGDIYLSNLLFKNFFLNEMNSVIHGPCVSDIHGDMDMANGLHSKFWVTKASHWTMRSNNSWPDENVKQVIIDHGVLLVPIGSKGSPYEELEWRMSFSVGEKFLIYTFSHTQLLCYALMKILLKDVINTDSRCKDLLCSYFMKTIMFWISEETPPSAWTPGNLIPCFMRCFRRLIYCVEYSVCPHYFIPENNLFENKVEGLDRDNLIGELRLLLSYQWRCILFSQQISHVSVLSCNVQSDHGFLHFDDLTKLINSSIYCRVSTLRSGQQIFSRAVYNIMSCTSNKLKYFHAFTLSALCNTHCQSMYVSSTFSNKIQYKQYNTCLSYLLMNINHNTVSGWMILASFFYLKKQYKKSLVIILYALSKCTLDKLFHRPELSVTQRLLVKLHVEQKIGLVSLLKFVHVDNIIFKTSAFIPTELDLIIETSVFVIPPVVYGHVLSFLCHYHLHNVGDCKLSLQDLQLTIDEDYFISSSLMKASSYYCLGAAAKLMGDNELAKQAFTATSKLLCPYPLLIKRFKGLAMKAAMG